MYKPPDHLTVVYKILLTYAAPAVPAQTYLEEASPRTSPSIVKATSPSIVKAIDLVRQCSVRKFLSGPLVIHAHLHDTDLWGTPSGSADKRLCSASEPVNIL